MRELCTAYRVLHGTNTTSLPRDTCLAREEPVAQLVVHLATPQSVLLKPCANASSRIHSRDPYAQEGKKPQLRLTPRRQTRSIRAHTVQIKASSSVRAVHERSVTGEWELCSSGSV